MRKNMIIRNGTLHLLLLALLCTLASPAAAAVRIKTYGQPSWTLGAALDINSAGQVAGIYEAGAGRQGFLYESGVYTDIGPAGWTNVYAWAIDENGRIAGYGDNGATQTAFVYVNGIYTPVLPAGWSSTRVFDMSDAGHVVGSGDDGPVPKGLLYNITTTGLTVLIPSGWSQASAQGVNNHGHAVGGGMVGGQQTAFLWKGGAYSNPAPVGWTGTSATGITNGGVIVGNGDDGGGHKCWVNDGGAFTTVLPPGHAYAHCIDINNSGAVFGFVITPAGDEFFIYQDGKYYLLGLGFPNAELISLNDDGVFAGARVTGGSIFEAITGSLFPEAAISANGESDAVGISSSAPLALKVAMESFSLAGLRCEWWLIVQTPSGIWSFDAASRRWLPGLRPTSTVRLRDIGPLRIPPVSKAPGLYTYYFGADGRVNGRIDPALFVFDTVTVHIR